MLLHMLSGSCRATVGCCQELSGKIQSADCQAEARLLFLLPGYCRDVEVMLR